MDKSTIIKKVSVPKVIPMKESWAQRMQRAKRQADKERAKKKLSRDISWDQMRHGGK